MPLLLSPDAYDDWLDPSRSEPDAVRALLASPLSDALVFRAVDARVNDVAADDPACLAPASQLSWL
jgi:putative SOS response-associated peptidase YedK